MKNSIIARLVIIFSLIGSVLYAVVNNELLHHERNSLATTFKDIEYMVSRARTTERWAHVQANLHTLTPADGKVRFWIFSDDPRFGYGKNLAELHEFANDPNRLGRMSINGKKYPLHTLTKILPAYLDRPTIRLTVGVDAASYFETLRTFVAAMTGLSLAGVLLVILCGYWI